MNAQTLDAMLADIAFAAPVSVDDCVAVRDALRQALPSAKIEVYCHTGTEVVIRVDGLRRVIGVRP